MARKVFYSWQSDRPNATNRSFILKALQAACAELSEDSTIDERPEVDHDTQNVPGSPDIVQTIFGKIDTAHVFIADVSLVTDSDKTRPCPNPNVLIELGYAIKTLGESGIMLVMNTAFGGPELLPFDLRTKRVTTYTALPDDTERAPERKKLQGAFQAGLKSIFEHSKSPLPGTEIAPLSLGDVARKAVEDAKPNAPSAVRKYMEWFGDQLEVLAPDRGAPVWDDAFIEALDRTIPLLVDFARLTDVIASHDAAEPARALFKGFEYVLMRYDIPEGFPGGVIRDTDFDLAKFVGHEALVMLVANLIRDARWSILGEILGEETIVKSGRGTRTRRLDDVSASVKTLAMRNERLRLNRRMLRADILKERHEKGELSKLVPFPDFLEAEFFLFLRAEVEGGGEKRWGARWAPWSAVYLGDAEPPRYLLEAKRTANAKMLAAALGAGSVEDLRDRLVALKPEVRKLLSQGDPFWEGPLNDFDPQTIGSK